MKAAYEEILNKFLKEDCAPESQDESTFRRQVDKDFTVHRPFDIRAEPNGESTQYLPQYVSDMYDAMCKSVDITN